MSLQAPLPSRPPLRERLIAARQAWLQDAARRGAAETALGTALRAVLQQLEPTVLGTYWPIRGEFNPAMALRVDGASVPWPLALPFARRTPHEMHYRHWDGAEPDQRDDRGIRASRGAPVVPDVVLVPCVGFTRDGYRLGYGGGYFDRWIAAHSGVTAVGVAWAIGEIAAGEFVPEPHDRALDLIVTEQDVVG